MEHWYRDDLKHDCDCSCKKCNSSNRVAVMSGNNNDDASVMEDADVASFVNQESDEVIWIKESINVNVHSTNTQAAISLQVGLQLAIALVISITLADSEEGNAVAQEFFQHFDTDQVNKQKIFVKNSKDVDIETTDTDLTVNIQALLQVLVTLVAKLDIL